MNIKKLSIILIITSIFLLSIVFQLNQDTHAKAEGANLEVSADGSTNYTKIQDAIDDASAGDTVYVYEGKYFENIVIDKSISLIGENIENTIIDGQELDNVITLGLNSNYTKISGFTIQNAGDDWYRAGIDVNSDHNIISNNLIRSQRYGIALDFWAHNCRISNNTFTGNSYGLKIYSTTPNNNIIYRNNFIENYIHGFDDSKGIWDYNGEGNYWDDYNGTDSDGDGIGDTPYYISGASTQDNNPLMEPVNTPGFELLIAIFAIIIVYLIKKKRK